MSHSNMKGYYNSSPHAYVLAIETMNEAKGSFTGKFGGASSTSSANVGINGGFSFDSSGKQTVLWFSTSDSTWLLAAPYYSDGEKFFETWSATRTSISNPNDVKQFQFNVDKSGEVGSWFGDVTINGEKVK